MERSVLLLISSQLFPFLQCSEIFSCLIISSSFVHTPTKTFVLDDGGETDLDLGNYERFLDVTLSKDHNITTGKVYTEVISRERRGDYLGKTVQIVPHATDLIMEWLQRVSKVPVDGSGQEPDVCLIEVGGTVGDIESMVSLTVC